MTPGLNSAGPAATPKTDVDDIVLGGFRQPEALHQLAVLANWAARRPICPTKSSS